MTCNFTVTGGCLRERAPWGTEELTAVLSLSAIISVSAGEKYEQKSLRDRGGPHRSPGPLLNHFWMAVIHYALLIAPYSLFIQPIPGEYYNVSVLQCLCVCVYDYVH